MYILICIYREKQEMFRGFPIFLNNQTIAQKFAFDANVVKKLFPKGVRGTCPSGINYKSYYHFLRVKRVFTSLFQASTEGIGNMILSPAKLMTSLQKRILYQGFGT